MVVKKKKKKRRNRSIKNNTPPIPFKFIIQGTTPNHGIKNS